MRKLTAAVAGLMGLWALPAHAGWVCTTSVCSNTFSTGTATDQPGDLFVDEFNQSSSAFAGTALASAGGPGLVVSLTGVQLAWTVSGSAIGTVTFSHSGTFKGYITGSASYGFDPNLAAGDPLEVAVANPTKVASMSFLYGSALSPKTFMGGGASNPYNITGVSGAAFTLDASAYAGEFQGAVNSQLDFSPVSGAAPLSFIKTAGGNPGTTTFNNDVPVVLSLQVTYDYAVHSVPEPISMALFASGIVGMVAARRRRAA